MRSTEALVANKETMLGSLARLTPGPLVVCRLSDGATLHASPAAAALFDADLSQLLGHHWTVLAARLLAGGLVQDEAFRLGQEPPRHVLLSARAEDGVAIFSLTDITERVRTETALRGRAAHLDLLAEYSEDVVWAMDGFGRFTYCSPAVTPLLGFSAEEVLAQKLADSVASGSYEVALERLTRLLTGDVPERGAMLELELNRKDGTTLWTEVSCNAVLDEQGRTQGVIGVTRDLSRRKATEDQLRLARDAALSASRGKSEFLAVMSHEIRTPLNGILGLARVMLDQATDTTQRQALTILKEAGHGLLTVLNDILDFSKMEAGRVEFLAEPFELAPVIAGIVALMEPRATEKGLGLSALVEPAVPCCLVGDAQRLRQVVINFLANAVKFTERGAIGIAVRVLAIGEGQAGLRFEVKDSGPGISAAARETLFQPFTQADATISRRFGGTGLGLAISKRIVDMLGGRIGIDPGGEGGTVAWAELTFPIAAGVRAPAPPCLESLPPLSILLAEDNPVNQLVAALLLRRQGHTVSVVEDGFAAVEAVRDGLFDLVLMDMQMPGMDGINATKAIRGLPQGGDLPIIAMTANAFHSDRDLCLAAGMDDYVSKPIDLEALLGVIRRTLGRVAATQNEE